MYLMYVDESGDCGLTNSPTRYFVLTGLVVHELRWQTYLDRLIAFRQQMKQHFGLRLREELHASAMVNHPGSLVRIKRHDRLAILRAVADELAAMTDLNLVNIVVGKQGKPDDSLEPSGYMRKKGGHNYFQRLAPILCKAASSKDPQGIVRL